MTKSNVRTGTYRFARNDSSVVGFLSSQRASTDAMSVVKSWELRGAGRSVEVLEDCDDHLVARLTFEDSDSERAAADLEALCADKGVQREPVAETRGR